MGYLKSYFGVFARALMVFGILKLISSIAFQGDPESIYYVIVAVIAGMAGPIERMIKGADAE